VASPLVLITSMDVFSFLRCLVTFFSFSIDKIKLSFFLLEVFGFRVRCKSFLVPELFFFCFD